MLSPESIRSSRGILETRPEFSFQEIALAMFPEMVERLVSAPGTPPSLEEQSSHEDCSRTKLQMLFPSPRS